GRIKIHGLLVKPDQLRLTKGYRNKIRAYAHVLATKTLQPEDHRRLAGHVQYADYVSRRTDSPSGIASTSLDWRDRQRQEHVAEISEQQIAASVQAERPIRPSGIADIFKRWFRI